VGQVSIQGWEGSRLQELEASDMDMRHEALRYKITHEIRDEIRDTIEIRGMRCEMNWLTPHTMT
jgi:hypothetical protein